MTKKTLDRDIILLLIFTLITLISWVGLEVYRAYTKPNIPDVSALLEPVDPKLNVTVLDRLEKYLP